MSVALAVVNSVAPLIITVFLAGNAALAFFKPDLARKIIVGKKGGGTLEAPNPSRGYIRLIGAMMFVILTIVAAGLIF